MIKTWPEKLQYAPICICPYSRYDLLKQVIAALQNNVLASESALFLFSDAPYRPDHTDAVQKVRDYLHTIDGFKHVFVIEREKNYGPINNYTNAYELLLERYERIIVLEDDIITSPFFLQYMNDALNCYKDHPKIMAISAYRAPFPAKCKNDIFFMQNFKSWGNATWKKWHEASIEFEAEEIIEKLKKQSLMKKFNYYSSIIIPNQRLLIQTAKKVINARDAVLRANILYKDGYVIFPSRSLTNHAGFKDGQHTGVDINDFVTTLADSPIKVEPLDVAENSKLVKSLHYWTLRVHLKLLIKYIFTLGPIRNYLKKMGKNKEF